MAAATELAPFGLWWFELNDATRRAFRPLLVT
jgi:hypothetical protein